MTRQRTWRDLTRREWLIPPPDGTIPWHPLWDTLRAAFCLFLIGLMLFDLFNKLSFWEAVDILVIFIIALGACLA